ncbi:MAG: T9SS type A sorting domain-containing protein [Bacteroidetes bacterium]|nr:T9SS type A sorting domain-containing protein [Bacteroidota bacterium]
MKKSTIIVLTSATALLFLGSSFKKLKHQTGIDGYSGGPGESTCTSCHGNSGGSSTMVMSTPTFSGNTYVPGQTYTITVRVANGSLTHFGFDCTILNSSNNDAGTMQNPASNTKFVTNSGNNRKNATHNGVFNAGGTIGNFVFEWVAPASGQVRFFAAGNTVNNNGANSGDLVSQTSMTLNPSGPVSIKENDPVSALNIYQNAAFNSLNLSYFKSTTDDLSLSIYDINGKEVMTKSLNNQQNGQVQNSVKLNDLAAGAYFVGLKSNTAVVAKKLIILQ